MIGWILTGFTVVRGLVKGVQASIKGVSLLKYVSPVFAGLSFFRGRIASFFRKYWKYIIIVALCGAVWGLNWYKDRVITGLRAEVVTLNENAGAYITTLARNNMALDNCRMINWANQQAYKGAMIIGEKAEARIKELEKAQNEQVEEINEEVTELRGRDEDCRSLDDPLPDWFDEWLRQ